MSDNLIDEAVVAAAWDRNADQWAKDVEAGFDLYRTLYTLPSFLDFMPDIKNKSVIDLGCGEGTNTRRFAERGAKMTGIDISRRLIEKARKREAQNPFGIRYENVSFSNMDLFESESFDGALSTMALMDGPDFVGTMTEVNRVLKPGGKLSFSILHPCFITPVLKWERDKDGAHLGLRVGRYFDSAPFIEHWVFSRRPSTEGITPFEVPRFPRTLSYYINAISNAGLRITKVDEP